MELTESQRQWLTLALVPGVGSTLFIRLLARFGRPEVALRAAEAELAEVVGPQVAHRIRQYGEFVDVEAQERLMRQCDTRLVTMDDPAYPPLLAEIYDPPLVLFTRGDLLEADHCAVAIVGTRKPTNYGVDMAERLGADLAARGITVISGMAEGIDAAAHRGALQAGGRTIAVVGSGADQVFPAMHADLMREIIQNGAVVSMFPMGMPAMGGNFPRRNRVISGLALGIIVVEAGPTSGSLITARHAAEQGREVFAVPGRAGHPCSMGPHALIREGAKLVESVNDVLVELNLPVSAHQVPPPPAESQLSLPIEQGTEKKPARRMTAGGGCPTLPEPTPCPPVSAVESDILSMLSPDGSFVDEISLTCRIPVSEALSALTMLELKGMVRQFSGKRFAPR
jgi:DNA processing protein